MIGFHDHVINRRSGRPEPHASWLAESFNTWICWVLAASMVVLAAYNYQKWGKLDGTLQILGGAILFSLIACVRRYALERKKRAFRKAVAAYDALLAKAAHDTNW